MRRIYDPYQYEFLKPLQPINEFITMSALILGRLADPVLRELLLERLQGREGRRTTRGTPNGLEWTTLFARRRTATGRARSPRSTAGPTSTANPDAPKDFVMQHEPPLQARPESTEHRWPRASSRHAFRSPAQHGGGSLPPTGPRTRTAAAGPEAGCCRSRASRPVAVPGHGDHALHRASRAPTSSGAAPADWRALALPGVLWANTAALLASSATLEMARRRLRRLGARRCARGSGPPALLGLSSSSARSAAWRTLAARGSSCSLRTRTARSSTC